MRKSLAALWGAILTGLLAAAAPVAAQDAPIPRLYPTTGFERAYTGKSPETLTREAQVADSFAAACDAGDLTGCTALGTAFETGNGRPQNRPVAELLYRQACEGAAAEGCYRLGKLLRFADDRRDWGQTAPLFVRACELGSGSGCDAQANDLEAGVTGVSDPDAALALRRATCAGGSAPSCNTLAAELMRSDRSAEEQAEGLALLDRQCRAGESRDCGDAVRHWIGAEGGFGARAREYQSLACRARDSWACAEIGKRALRNGIGPEAREAGVAFYQRACELTPYHCDAAQAVRDEPAQRAACDLGDRTACIAIGKQYVRQGGPLEDLPRGIELLSAACLTAGNAEEAQELCETAGNLTLDQAVNGSDEARTAADPARIDGLYTAACAAGSNSACVNLADALWSGAILPSDQPRALALYEALCDADYSSGCSGLRKAIRLMEMASRFGLPVVTLVDTSGAFPGIEAEERGQAEAIARATEACLALEVPMVAAIVGEGGSGGAVALASANRVLMLEHAVYSVISPEGCASILWRTSEKAADAAQAMKVTAQDLKRINVIDRIVKEPLGGAQRDPVAAARLLGAALTEELDQLSGKDRQALVAAREARFLAIGG